jgi:hypothetical protein
LIYISYASTEGEGNGGKIKLFAPSSKKNESLTSSPFINVVPTPPKGSNLFPELFLIMPSYLFFSAGERGKAPLVIRKTLP